MSGGREENRQDDDDLRRHYKGNADWQTLEWNAWVRLETMSKSTAKDLFCSFIDQFYPGWRSEMDWLFKQIVADLKQQQEEDLPPLESVEEQRLQDVQASDDLALDGNQESTLDE